MQDSIRKREDIILALKEYFQRKADTHDINMVFLYGSWACGYPKEESDIDVAVLFNQLMSEDRTFDIVNDIALELTNVLKRETNVLYVDNELSKPMLHYNVIVHGVPVFMKDFSEYVDIRLKVIFQMEDFNIFGTKWQSEVVKKRMEVLNA